MGAPNHFGKNEPLTRDQMKEYQEQKRDRSMSTKRGITPYTRTEYDPVTVGNMIDRFANEMVTSLTTDKIDLSDTETVFGVVKTYLDVCAETGTYPTNMGLARSLGYSQRSLNTWRKRYPNHPTGELLEMFADTCSEYIAQCAIQNKANNVFSIFMLKAQYKWRDNIEVSVAQEEPEKPLLNADEIRSRYLLPDDCTNDDILI